jgi:hypothetical protein
MAEKVSLESLVEMILDIGYRSTALSDNVVRTAMSGKRVLIFYYENSLQFYYGVVNDNDVFTIEDANIFNEKHRFAKCYIDESGISFEMDVFFNLKKSSAKSSLELYFEAFETSISAADKSIGSALERTLRPPKE